MGSCLHATLKPLTQKSIDLLTNTGMTLDNLSLYVNLVDGVGQKTLKVDTLGSGNFSAPDS